MEEFPKFEEYVLKNKNGMQVRCTNYGAIITGIEIPTPNGKIVNVVLGFDSPLDYYRSNIPYFGCMAGRYAGKIANGTFEIDNKKYHLRKNERGINHMHGGLKGFDKVFWNKSSKSDLSKGCLVLEYESKDSEEGYPGKLNIETHYILNDENEFFINSFATTDKTTIINITNHSYFNLNGDSSGDILDHTLFINAKELMAFSPEGNPTNKFSNIEGTPFDFRNPKSIREFVESKDEKIVKVGGLFNLFIFDKNGKVNASLQGNKTGIKMEIETNQAAMFVYTSNFLDALGRKGFAYKKHAGICLETENVPGFINSEDQSKIQLAPNETFKHLNKFKFTFSK